MVIDGVVKRTSPVRLLRDNVVIWTGELESLKRFKDDVKEVKAGLRVRPVAEGLQRHQGRRPARGLRGHRKSRALSRRTPCDRSSETDQSRPARGRPDPAGSGRARAARGQHPRVGMVTLTGVEVTPDYAHAKVYFTMLGAEPEVGRARRSTRRPATSTRCCSSACRSTRSRRLQFVHDASVERGFAIDQLIDGGRRSRLRSSPKE